MKKKLMLFTTILTFTLFVFGCSPLEYIKYEKPKINYYTTKLSDLVNNKDYEIQILDTNVYRTIDVDKEDVRIIPDLINNLKSDNFLTEEPEGLPVKSMYKLFIMSKDNKMVLDVYGDDIISIYPWDGDFEKDYLSLKGVPNAFKAEQFCKYVFEK